jgi:hypothetical protein
LHTDWRSEAECSSSSGLPIATIVGVNGSF